MAKTIIGALVGAILLFMWQFLSWAAMDLHRPQQQYTPNQDTILTFLNSQINGDGGFYLPNVSENASSADREALMKNSIGKPWVQIFYHKEMKNNMVSNMSRAFAINIIVLLLFIWLMGKLSNSNFSTVFLASMATGLIVYLNSPYLIHIWYETFDATAHLMDAVVSWALVGVWLGWWLNRKK